MTRLKLYSKYPLFLLQVLKSCQLIDGKLTVIERLSKRRCILFATTDDQLSYSELEIDDFEQEIQAPLAEGASPTKYLHIEGSEGKPGFISFYNRPRRKENEILVSTTGKNQNSLLWFVGPTILVASFIVPSLYLRKILSTIFEDSLLTGKQNLC